MYLVYMSEKNICLAFWMANIRLLFILEICLCELRSQDSDGADHEVSEYIFASTTVLNYTID